MLSKSCILMQVFSKDSSSAIAQSFKEPNYKSHKTALAPAPSFFFQFLYKLKKFLVDCFNGGRGGGLSGSFLALGCCCC